MKSLLTRCFVLFLFIFLLVTLPARAIIDTNINGVSDLWERLYNSGNLFSTFDLNADPDGDGWTNAQEATAGTHPFNANAPAGLIRPKITHTPAVYVSPVEEEDTPEILTPEAVTIIWPTLAGKKYTLLFSADLTPGSWIHVGNPRIGNGTEIGKGIPLTQSDGSIPAGMFWRVAVEDTDTDGDLLTDAEERKLGSSVYLSDTDGDGINDSMAYAAGKNPSGGDANGDGVLDCILYSVEFEIRQESHAMPNGIGYKVLKGTDNVHRYLTSKQSEEYSISGSARYASISAGKKTWTYTYLDGESITANGQTLSKIEGSSRYDWESAHPLSLGDGEYSQDDATQTSVTGPTISATESVTITTNTTVWRVKKHVAGNPNDTTVRSGTETITTTDRNKLSDPVTYQNLWTNYLMPKAWAEWDESAPYLLGPHNWMDYNRAYFGDADAAESVRDYFSKGNFDVSAIISAPGSVPIDYGSDNRLKSLRWRWVRFNPLSPFDYEYSTPPASYQKRFHFLVQQRNLLRDRSGEPPVTTIDETLKKGVVEIHCNGSDGAGWHTINLNKFSSYKLEEPISQADIDFSKWGYSQVWFENLPLEIVQGEPGAADQSTGEWLAIEASPTPEVDMKIASAEVIGTSVQVRVTGTVKDELSRMAKNTGDKVHSIRFSFFGEDLGTFNLTGDVGVGATFDETLTIPNAKACSYTIRAETEQNKAGNTAWDEIAVSLQLVSRSNSSGIDSSTLRVAFPIIPTGTTTDSAKVYFAARDPQANDASITETANASNIFEGLITYESGAAPCSLKLRGPLSFNITSIDHIDCDLKVGDSNSPGNSIKISLVETGVNTRMFKIPVGTPINNDFELKVLAKIPLAGSRVENFARPLTLKLNKNIDDVSARITLNGSEYPIKLFTFNGNEGYYPYEESSPAHPKQFLPSIGFVPSHLKVTDYVANGSTQILEFKLKLAGEEYPLAKINVEPGTPRPSESSSNGIMAAGPSLGIAASSSAAAPATNAAPARWAAPGDAVTKEDLLTAFEFLYGEHGMQLLSYFQAGGGIIELGNIWGDLDIDAVTMDAHIYIQIEANDAEVAGTKYHPGVAAQLLWNGLNQCLGYSQIRNQIDDEDFETMMQAQQASGQIACEIGVAAGEIYLTGLSIVNEGADRVMMLDELSQGHYAALAGALPFIPANIFSKGGKLLFKSKAGVLLGGIDDAAALTAVKDIYKIADPEERLRVMGVVVEREQFKDTIRKILTAANGPIAEYKNWQHRFLKKRMKAIQKTPFPTAQAHHDFPWIFQKDFAKVGFDVNDPAFGRWISQLDHNVWHTQMPKKYNDFWKDFFDLAKREKRTVTKQEVLDKLAEARSIYTVNNGL